MAQPAFQAKELIERHSIAVISGNLQFYTDMSNRVMQVFGELVPAVEKYSIDECFLDLTGIPQELTAFCQDLKRTVRQWTGLPISIGIAETKTLAKIANRLAKTSAKTDGVLDLTGERWRDRALASTEVGDVWGIGRQYAQKLNRNGVMTALDLARRPDGWIRKEMGVGGLKTVRELRGEDCIGFDDMPQPKQTTMVSRSFGTEVRDYDELANAIAMFATDAARSIRRANLVSTSVSVFIETNRLGKSPHHDQVVGRRREAEGPIYLGPSPQLGPAHPGHRLDPAKGLLDALADPLTDGVTGMPGRPPVDGRTPPAGVPGHMRADVVAPQFLDEVRGIVAAIRAQSGCSWPVRQGLDHLQRRSPFGMAGDPCQSRIDDQTRAVLHQAVPDVTQPRLHARTLAVQHRIGIGGALMGRSRAPLAPEVGTGIVPAAACATSAAPGIIVGRTVPRLEAPH